MKIKETKEVSIYGIAGIIEESLKGILKEHCEVQKYRVLSTDNIVNILEGLTDLYVVKYNNEKLNISLIVPEN